jgi:hypothetical protein
LGGAGWEKKRKRHEHQKGRPPAHRQEAKPRRERVRAYHTCGHHGTHPGLSRRVHLSLFAFKNVKGRSGWRGVRVRE